ncbi:MAG: NTP/NDP exchange transporter [Hyphomicrobiales bacterium]
MTTADTVAGPQPVSLAKKSAILFVNFFLIILAYYQVKSASRSLLIEYWGSGNFPYVWIISALVLGIFIGFYYRMVARYSRTKVVLGCILLFIAILLGFRLWLHSRSPVAAITFYIFVDIFSVVLVEQFWSLANTITAAEAGKKSYWFVGTGGLIGGAVGGAIAAGLLELGWVSTPDLLLVCAGLLGFIFVLNLSMAKQGLFDEIKPADNKEKKKADTKSLIKNRYILLIAAALLCAQLVQPVVEFQFIKAIEEAYSNLDERTQFFSAFFGILGIISIVVNLTLTPFIHRYLGIFAGMLVQPLATVVFSFGFLAQPNLLMASIMKIADRGLNYSINRASKEQLYIPLDPEVTYQAKAWIDMLGYRMFKIAGAGLILLLTQWLPIHLSAPRLSWLTFIVCALWCVVIAMLAREYKAVQNKG